MEYISPSCNGLKDVCRYLSSLWTHVPFDSPQDPFLPAPFSTLVKEGSFDPSIPIFAGVNSEEGLILSAPFHKSAKRWRLLFKGWDKWAPQLFFNRETELVNKVIRVYSGFSSGDSVGLRYVLTSLNLGI